MCRSPVRPQRSAVASVEKTRGVGLVRMVGGVWFGFGFRFGFRFGFGFGFGFGFVWFGLDWCVDWFGLGWDLVRLWVVQ